MVRTVCKEKGKKMGGGCKIPGYCTLFSAAHLFPLLTLNAVHHSATALRALRNLQQRRVSTLIQRLLP